MENYTIRVELPDGFLQTAPDGDDDFAITITPGPDETVSGLAFGIIDPVGGVGSGRISGRVFADLNGNGIDDGEPAQEGITVFLDENRNGRLNGNERSRETLADGTYSFAGLGESEYQIGIVLPDGKVQTTHTRVEFDTDSDELAVGIQPLGVVSLLYNDDLIPDLAVLTNPADVLIYEGNGDGSFGTPFSALAGLPPSVVGSPRDIAVADFNHDGLSDLVIANQGYNFPTVLMRQAGGGFVQGTVPAVDNGVSRVTTGLFNNDSHVDIAVASAFSNVVRILLGNGTGTFAASPTRLVTDLPTDLAAVRFEDSQGLVVGRQTSSDLRNFIQQDGSIQTADFSGLLVKDVGRVPFRLAAGDLTGDGIDDVVVTGVGANAPITMFETRRGIGAFEEGVRLFAGINASDVAIVDLNGDGRNDIAVTTAVDSGISTLLNLGGGRFQSANISGVANLAREILGAPLVASDLDLDGDTDLVVVQPRLLSGDLIVHLNTPTAGPYVLSVADGETVDGINFGIGSNGTEIGVDRDGNLRIADPFVSGQDDRLTLSVSGNTLIITEATNTLVSSVGTAIDPQTVHVPLSSIRSGRVIIDTAAGDDVVDANGVTAALSLTINGGPGDDSLTSGAGDDIVNGGGGTDTLNGNAGTDTLRFASGPVNLTAIADNLLTGFEQIDLRGPEVSSLTLNRAEVVNLSSASDQVTVFKDPSDTVADGGGWTASGSQVIAGLPFDVLAQSGATLAIQTVPRLMLTIDRSSIDENGGVATAMLTRNTARGAELIVDISSDLPGQVSFSADPVTIESGRASATFTISGLNDSDDDGTAALTITAAADGFISGTANLDVVDDDDPVLTLRVGGSPVDQTSVVEGQRIDVEVVRNSAPQTALVVTLTSSRPGQAGVPSTVTIEPGQRSAVFQVTGVDDTRSDGLVTVTITASASGFPNDAFDVDVTDNDSPALTVDIIASSINENGGASIVRVTRNTSTAVEQVVSLSVPNAQAGQINLPDPATVTIPVDADFVEFEIAAEENEIADGDRTVEVSASASGFQTGRDSVRIVDDEQPGLTLLIDLLEITEGGPGTTATIRRNTPPVDDLVVTLTADARQVTILQRVTIAAGESSTQFQIIARDDLLRDRDATVTVLASAANHSEDEATLRVLDDDVNRLSISLTADSVLEGGNDVRGTVTRNSIDGDLTVRLVSSDPERLHVASTITILDGEQSADFVLTGVDDELAGATGVVAVSASATGFIGATALPTLVDNDGGSVLGEVRTIDVQQSNPADWQLVRLSRRYANPVVVCGPLTTGDNSPATIRVRNVTPTSFEFQIDEWDYLLSRDNGAHGAEQVSYLVIEAGTHTLADGTRIVAGLAEVTSSPRSIDITSFDAVPIVLPQVMTTGDPSAVTARVTDVTGSGFTVQLQEEEAADQAHGAETVGYVAIEPGSGRGNGLNLLALRTGDNITSQPRVVSLSDGGFTMAPALFAATQTLDGLDPITVRQVSESLTSRRVALLLDEEQSFDLETTHTTEVVGLLAIDEGRLTGYANTIPQVSIHDARTSETQQTVRVSVTLDRLSSVPVTVGYRTVSGTALAGPDFVADEGAIQFAPGQREQFITLTVLPDRDVEGVENFAIELTSILNATVGDPSGSVTIAASDQVEVTVTVTDGVIELVSAVGDINSDLTLFRDADTDDIVVQSLAATLDDGSGTLKSEVRIAAAGIIGMRAELDGGADSFDASGLDVPVTIDGGSGDDSLIGSSAGDLLIGGPGHDLLNGQSGDDTLLGGFGHDTLDGGAGNDLLRGAAGNDELRGGPGSDLVNGGADADRLAGGDDPDIILGGGGRDVLDEFVSGIVLLARRQLMQRPSNSSNNVVDRLRHLEFASLLGGDADDDIDLSRFHGAVTVSGGDGADRILGSQYNDVLMGGRGNDTLLGTNGNDFLSGDDGDDSLLGGFGRDVLRGKRGSDHINGNADRDTIAGGSGLGTDAGDDLQDSDGDDIIELFTDLTDLDDLLLIL